ncbi:hypothetical protein EVAR_29682_1 [Eumeta japonica]|uniref:Uncharacterized protein n=1 Tax=Eumeta variegata TaxID=151549 RepID=A0A4C1W969_EUMVA|nr:hypothetical protein EVAR_29682_1 [Eumeta japonica]
MEEIIVKSRFLPPVPALTTIKRLGLITENTNASRDSSQVPKSAERVQYRLRLLSARSKCGDTAVGPRARGAGESHSGRESSTIGV